MPTFAEVEFRLMKFQAVYMQHLQEMISQAFTNIAEVKDGYLEQENRIVEKVCKQELVRPYRTTLVDTVYTAMNNFVRTVEGQLFSERLHEVFICLATELTNFVTKLRIKSQEEARRTDIAGFIRMEVRLNEVQELYAEFQAFKPQCLSLTSEQLKHRTESVLNQEDAAMVGELHLIVKSVALFICRQQRIQNKYLSPVFMPIWLSPQGEDIQNPV